MHRRTFGVGTAQVDGAQVGVLSYPEASHSKPTGMAHAGGIGGTSFKAEGHVVPSVEKV